MVHYDFSQMEEGISKHKKNRSVFLITCNLSTHFTCKIQKKNKMDNQNKPVQNFVNLLGGTIEAQSKVGEGSAFAIYLPVRAGHTERKAVDWEPTVALAP